MIITIVHGAFLLFVNVHAQILELNILAKNVLRQFGYWNRENAKKVSALDRINFLIEENFYSLAWNRRGYNIIRNGPTIFHKNL